MNPVKSGGTIGYVEGDTVYGPNGRGDILGYVSGDKVYGPNRRSIVGYVDGRRIYKSGILGRGAQIGTVCGSDVQNSRSARICTINGSNSDEVMGAAALLLGLLD